MLSAEVDNITAECIESKHFTRLEVFTRISAAPAATRCRLRSSTRPRFCAMVSKRPMLSFGARYYRHLRHFTVGCCRLKPPRRAGLMYDMHRRHSEDRSMSRRWRTCRAEHPAQSDARQALIESATRMTRRSLARMGSLFRSDVSAYLTDELSTAPCAVGALRPRLQEFRYVGFVDARACCRGDAMTWPWAIRARTRVPRQLLAIDRRSTRRLRWSVARWCSILRVTSAQADNTPDLARSPSSVTESALRLRAFEVRPVPRGGAVVRAVSCHWLMTRGSR